MFQTFLFWGAEKSRDGPFMAILYPFLEPACCLYNPYRRKEETRN